MNVQTTAANTRYWGKVLSMTVQVDNRFEVRHSSALRKKKVWCRTFRYIRAHLTVDHVGDTGVGALTRLWPDHHVSSVDSRAGPQQLLQQHL